MTEELTAACFQVITYVGTARSCYVNAIQSAKAGNYEEAAALIKQGDEAFVQGHDGHQDLLTKEMNGELDSIGILVLHAEDQLMSAEGFKIIAEEFITLYKRLDGEQA